MSSCELENQSTKYFSAGGLQDGTGLGWAGLGCKNPLNANTVSGTVCGLQSAVCSGRSAKGTFQEKPAVKCILVTFFFGALRSGSAICGPVFLLTDVTCVSSNCSMCVWALLGFPVCFEISRFQDFSRLFFFVD